MRGGTRNWEASPFLNPLRRYVVEIIGSQLVLVRKFEMHAVFECFIESCCQAWLFEVSFGFLRLCARVLENQGEIEEGFQEKRTGSSRSKEI